jgi:hypothetical protein
MTYSFETNTTPTKTKKPRHKLCPGFHQLKLIFLTLLYLRSLLPASLLRINAPATFVLPCTLLHRLGLLSVAGETYVNNVGYSRAARNSNSTNTRPITPKSRAAPWTL